MDDKFYYPPECQDTMKVSSLSKAMLEVHGQKPCARGAHTCRLSRVWGGRTGGSGKTPLFCGFCRCFHNSGHRVVRKFM